MCAFGLAYRLKNHHLILGYNDRWADSARKRLFSMTNQ